MRDLDGQLLLLGVGHDADTSLHLAELIAKVVALSAAVAKAHRRPFLMEFRRINETNEINETNDLKKGDLACRVIPRLGATIRARVAGEKLSRSGDNSQGTYLELVSRTLVLSGGYLFHCGLEQNGYIGATRHSNPLRTYPHCRS